MRRICIGDAALLVASMAPSGILADERFFDNPDIKHGPVQRNVVAE